ncbi:MAG: class I SAM-dependent methyltransferase [Oscillospiraceae bacterium]|jgi:23S rRNA (cytosine1962-C5)-methyltransferase|nr:class I SAM-dependent methyltransferase [Oscillospiraceae bacterium]
MRISDRWHDYDLIDTASGERLERWGEYILIRPDPQVIWVERTSNLWEKAAARYHRSANGGGQWEFLHKLPEDWQISWQGIENTPQLHFKISPMGFKHTGIFPEQAVNWEYLQVWITELLKKHNTAPRVLNLFAYTGGATLACLAAGAHVTHVDAAKGMVQRAKENAGLSGLAERPMRWIVEDCLKFTQREVRRGVKYDIIIMDPPSYGRGPGGEVWKFEEQINRLLDTCIPLLQPSGLLLLNFYTESFSPGVIEYFLRQKLLPRFGGEVHADEIGLRVSATDWVLPCGATAMWQGKKP